MAARPPRIADGEGRLSADAVQRALDGLSSRLDAHATSAIANGGGQLVRFNAPAGVSLHRVPHGLGRRFRVAFLSEGTFLWSIANANGGELSESEVRVSMTGDDQDHYLLIF